VNRKWLLVLVFGLSLSALCLGGENSSGLEAVLAPLAKAHQGKVAIAVKNLNTGETYTLNADVPMPTASLCKFPVLIEVYQQVAEGKVKLADPIKVRKEDLVPGSGVLKYLFDPETTITLHDAVRLMIGVSDNTATNLVLDKIGIGATAKRMEALGYPNTKIHSKSFRGDTSVFPERSRKFGLGSTTAADMVSLLEKCHRGEIVSPEASKEIIATLRLAQDTERMTRYLVDTKGVSFAHKPGAVDNAKTDAGIMFFKEGPVALCILTSNNKDTGYAIDNAGNVFIGKVTKAVYDYFTTKK
jgi:beta-lactamase class A